MPLTRIAPTPSGFIHEGNRLNFRLTSDLAMSVGATLALRIDDADAPRYRRAYVDDIFATLQAMGIEWQVGPRDTDDFESHWSQQDRTDYYRAELEEAINRGLDVYACACSRAEQRVTATGGCVGGCRRRDRALTPNETALRVAVNSDTVVMVGGTRVDLATAMGDFVIWRRDDLPSYHLVSVVEDRDLGVTHIVRGEDLVASSAAQVHVAPWLAADTVREATYVHHGLMTDSSGSKLSKSTLTHGGNPT